MLRSLGLFICLLCMSCTRPLAGFDVGNDSGIEAPASVGFINRSENAKNYFWDFGDGKTSMESNPSHVY